MHAPIVECRERPFNNCPRPLFGRPRKMRRLAARTRERVVKTDPTRNAHGLEYNRRREDQRTLPVWCCCAWVDGHDPVKESNVRNPVRQKLKYQCRRHDRVCEHLRGIIGRVVQHPNLRGVRTSTMEMSDEART